MAEHSRTMNTDSFIFFNSDDESENEFENSRSYGVRNGNSIEPEDSVNLTSEKEGMPSEIDQTIKNHFDKLLHSVDALSSRLYQIESKTRKLENAVDNLKVSAEYNNGRTEGKLKQIEAIMIEVQDGIQIIRDKEEIAETELQLAKLKGPKGSIKPEDRKTAVQADSILQASSSSSTSRQCPPQLLPTISDSRPLQPPALHPNAPSTLPYPNASPAGPPVATHTHSQVPDNTMASSLQAQSYYSPAMKTSESTYQRFNMTPPQQAQLPAPAPPQLYDQPTPNIPHVSQSPQQPRSQLAVGAIHPQSQPPWSHHPEETPSLPSHNYQPSIIHSSSLPRDGPPVQQFYMDSPHSRRFNSEYPAGYSWTPGPANSSNIRPYGGSLSHYSGSTAKPTWPSPPSDGESYPQLPKAQILPHALPTASIVDTGSSSGGAGNKVPIDDVVDKVTAMGFRRDLVKTTVRKLTENGQSVDLNVVLDKLMNN